MIYAYFALCIATGVISEFVRPRVTMALGVVCLLAGALADSWRWMDSASGEAVTTLLSGLVYHFVPLAGLFVTGFLTGRYVCRGIRKLLANHSQQSRGAGPP